MVAACHTATSYFNLWLKSSGYSVVQANTLPTGGNALAIVVTLLWGILADRTGKRFLLINSLLVLMMVSNIMLSIWNIPKGALMFAFYLSYAGSATTPVLIVSPHLYHYLKRRQLEGLRWPVSKAWGNNLNAGDPNLRQLLVATSNIVSYAWVLWVPRKLSHFYNHPSIDINVSTGSGSLPNLRCAQV